MTTALLIMLREGFEGALVVAIVFAYLRRIGRMDLGRATWLGVAAAAAISIGVGVTVHLWTDGLEGVARIRTFAAGWNDRSTAHAKGPTNASTTTAPIAT